MPFNQIDGQCFSVGDVQIYVQEGGDPDGQALLLLHGGLGDAHDFDAILSSLPQHLRLIALELRGQGRSSRGFLPLSYAQYDADVLAVLDQLGITNAGILGFSDGGIVGYRLAASVPERVRLLVTLGALWRLRGADDPSIPLLRGLTKADWDELLSGAIARYEAQNPQPDFDVLLEAVKTLWMDVSETGYPSETVRQITVPTLIVRDDADPLLSLKDAVALRERIAGSGFLNIPLVGHSAHEEATAVFIAAVNDFLRTCPPCGRCLKFSI